VIYHIIRMRLRDDVGPERLDRALEALADGGRNIPAVKFFAHGRESGGGFDWTAIFGFEDLDAYQEYLTHPLHKRSERLGFPLMAGLETFDFSLSAEPDLESRIVEMQRANFRSDPELVELVADLEFNAGTATLPE
jgi:Stress responsive A/B Barrel Domain